MTFRVRKLPKDKADLYMMKNLGVDTSITMTVNFNGGIFDNKVTKAIMDDKQLFTTTEGLLGEVAVIGERSVVTDVKVNGKSKERTVYLDEKNNSLIRPYYMLSVKLNDKGYPSYDSLCKSVIDFIDNTPELNKVLP